ncbi:MAG: thymidine kinase, partial [Bacteroidales bacterium]|nr:thymidine kinase [Bacteroidales bacterium]
IANQSVEIFKPELEKRFNEEDVVSHNQNALSSVPVKSSSQILLMASEVEVVGIDEAQFFDNELPNVCNQLANNGVRVVVAGLDMDFKGEPFGPMPYILAIANFITKVHAICIQCGALAQFSHRKVKGDQQVMLGETDSYVPLCRKCFNEKFHKK